MSKQILTGARILVALVASIAATAQASPLGFSNPKYDTTAFAFSGASADVNSAASPTPLPLISNATVAMANDFATASALGASGLLLTTAEADSFPGAIGASASAQSHFTGTILGSGLLNLHLHFDTLPSALSGGKSSSTLFIMLTNSVGGTLFNGFFDASRDTTLLFHLAGASSTLDLLMFSDASTVAAGQSAQSFAQLTFDGTVQATFNGTVPLPETLPLVIGGLAGIFVVRRKAANRAA